MKTVDIQGLFENVQSCLLHQSNVQAVDPHQCHSWPQGEHSTADIPFIADFLRCFLACKVL